MFILLSVELVINKDLLFEELDYFGFDSVIESVIHKASLEKCSIYNDVEMWKNYYNFNFTESIHILFNEVYFDCDAHGHISAEFSERYNIFETSTSYIIRIGYGIIDIDPKKAVICTSDRKSLDCKYINEKVMEVAFDENEPTYNESYVNVKLALFKKHIANELNVCLAD